jgi:hypothetical protein
VAVGLNRNSTRISRRAHLEPADLEKICHKAAEKEGKTVSEKGFCGDAARGTATASRASPKGTKDSRENGVGGRVSAQVSEPPAMGNDSAAAKD